MTATRSPGARSRLVKGTSPAATTLLRDYGASIIDGELRRLARRAPGLGECDLAAVRSVLDDILDELLLARAESLDHRGDEIRLLFGLGGDDP